MSTARESRRFFLIAIILLSYNMLSAQIRIKERVEIKPDKILKSIDDDVESITLPTLNPNDFAIQSGHYIENYNEIYNDHIFIPRVGGVIKTAWDIWYSYNWFVIQNGLEPWENRLLVFGPDGKVRYKFNVGDFWDSDGNLIAYSYSQEKYWYDRAVDSVWQARDSTYQTDTTKWGWELNLNLEIPVTAWEPLRFRMYYGPSGIATSPSVNYVFTYTSYPSEYTGGWGRMTFPCTGNLCSFYYGNKFEMVFFIDSNKVGNTPIVYSDQPEIFIPDSGMYRVVIGSVLPNVNGTLSIIDTTLHVLVTDIRSHQGDTILVGPYSEGTAIKFDLSGMAQAGGYEGYFTGGTQIVFESWTDYDFQDARIWFEYAAGHPNHLELWSTTSTIYYGDTIDIEVVPCDADSLFSPIGEDYLYEFSIELTGETSKYVELVYEDQGSDIVEHIPSYNRRGIGVRLAANKEEPDSVVNLTFHLKAICLGEIIAASIKDGSGTRSSIEVTVNQKLEKQNKGIVNDGLRSGKDAQQKAVIKSSTKRLQSLSINKSRKIGHPISIKDNKNTSAVSLSKKKILASTMNGESENVWLENDWYIGESKYEIMLGETKYFKARKNPDPRYPHNIIIEEVTTDPKTGEPLSDAGEEVEFSVAQQHETGVYWERKWPSWIDKTLKGKTYKIAEMKDLKKGLVRVIGRYWQEGSSNRVYLWAQLKSDPKVAGYIIIYVKKPAKLIDWENITGSVDANEFNNSAADYSKSNDVFGQPYNVDEIVISNAGESGIPPQMIKAQMFQESDRTGFQFNPSYRYEPFKDYNWQIKHKKYPTYSKQPFYITEEFPHGDGTGIPCNHSFLYADGVKLPGYPTSRIKICDYTLNSWNKYWKYIKDGTEIEIIGSDELTELWKSELNKWTFNWIIPGLYPNDLAIAAVKDKIKSYTNYAQTRKMASYGIIQMMYVTAVEKRIGFNEGKSIQDSSPPESLNDYNTLMPLYKKFTLNNLKLNWGKNVETIPDHEWLDGWEATWRTTLSKYNGRIYSIQTSSRTNYFEPKK